MSKPSENSPENPLGGYDISKPHLTQTPSQDISKPHFAGLALLLPGDVVSFRVDPAAQEGTKGMHNHATEVSYLRPEKDIWSDDEDDDEEAPSPPSAADADWRKR